MYFIVLFLQSDMLGDSIQSYVYGDDYPELLKALSTDDCFTTGNPDSLEENSNSSEESTPRVDYSNFKPQRRSFHLRMAQRTNSRREAVHYEYVHISGVLRLATECHMQIEQNIPRRGNATLIFIETNNGIRMVFYFYSRAQLHE